MDVRIISKDPVQRDVRALHILAPLLAASLLGACTRAAVPEGGARHFDTAIFLEDSAATSANVSVGDVDGDGHLDVVLVKGRHWPLLDLVLLGDGNGGFADPYAVGPDADRSYSGELVDLDGDGDLDIVVSNDDPDPKLVHLNDGTGHFSVGSTFGEPEWSTRHLAVADFDGDTRLDAVLANRYGDNTGPSFICFGTAEGGFNAPCVAVSMGSATTITPADLNGDGAPDLVVPHRDGGQSYVYLNDGAGHFEERHPFGPPDANIRSAKVADLDGDGVPDLAAIDERTGPALFMGEPGVTFGPAQPLDASGARPYAIRVADMDGNGRPDIIVGFVESRPIVYFNDGPGAFTPVPFGDDEGSAYGFAVGDLNEDGLLDIAMARSEARNVLYLGSR
ncbi:MAG: VCBS repeat-containing protein [Gemmatimonadota bacterium]